MKPNNWHSLKSNWRKPKRHAANFWRNWKKPNSRKPIQKALAALSNAKSKAEDDLQQLTEQIAAGTAVVKVPGSYRGYGFQDGHLRVRDKTGAIGDTTKILAAAASGDAQAQEIMDWLIKINYAYLKQVEE